MNWTLESGPHPPCGFEDSDYVDVSYSIRDGGDTFRVQQRVANTRTGYGKAYERIERIVARKENSMVKHHGKPAPPKRPGPAKPKPPTY